MRRSAVKVINIAKEFSVSPAGRVPADGPFNGERFRNDFLAPALNKNDKVVVVLDGVSGFGSSFLEEAFGGLVRKKIASPEMLGTHLEIQYSDQKLAFYAELIHEFINEARPE